MLKRLVHWLIAIALVLHLVSCLVFGEAHLPELPF